MVKTIINLSINVVSTIVGAHMFKDKYNGNELYATFVSASIVTLHSMLSEVCFNNQTYFSRLPDIIGDMSSSFSDSEISN